MSKLIFFGERSRRRAMRSTLRELYHSSGYVSGERYRGKRSVVVGAASSGHDVCADLWEHGAEVTMIQRSPTTVVKSETLMELGFKGLYSEEAVAKGVTTEKADLLFASIPFRLVPAVQIPLYERIAAQDADLLRARGSGGLPPRLAHNVLRKHIPCH